MKTLLAFRPVNVRLAVAHLAQAYFNFKNTEPLDTIHRMCTDIGEPVEYAGNRFMKDKNVHAYTAMWCYIGEFYDDMFSSCSDQEILAKASGYLRTGFTYKGTDITSHDIIQASILWDKREWDRYEERRNGRRSFAYKAISPVAVLAGACFGVLLPSS